MKSIKSTWVIILILLSPTLMADHKQKHQHKEFSQERHAQQFDFGRVIEVEPVYRQVRVSNPVKECWDEPVQHSGSQHRSAGGMLAGGLLGGIVGHQIGDGRGKKLATAVGTIVGAQIGHEAVNGHSSTSTEQHTRYQEHCEVRHQVNFEEVIDGYRVTYKYRGDRYTINMPYDPGKRIKLRIQVTPVI
ncbi:MAG: glycine zipper 2TM domain-containing protein [Gammaproteobacteria bacterium]|nr:glycine zipper 2TM domain-containing protein [Gammaproteobacteria bacterium]